MTPVSPQEGLLFPKVKAEQGPWRAPLSPETLGPSSQSGHVCPHERGCCTLGTGFHEATQASLSAPAREARPPTGQCSAAGAPLQQPRAHREPCELLSDYLSADTELSTS